MYFPRSALGMRIQEVQLLRLLICKLIVITGYVTTCKYFTITEALPDVLPRSALGMRIQEVQLLRLLICKAIVITGYITICKYFTITEALPDVLSQDCSRNENTGGSTTQATDL